MPLIHLELSWTGQRRSLDFHRLSCNVCRLVGSPDSCSVIAGNLGVRESRWRVVPWQRDPFCLIMGTWFYLLLSALISILPQWPYTCLHSELQFAGFCGKFCRVDCFSVELCSVFAKGIVIHWIRWHILKYIGISRPATQVKSSTEVTIALDVFCVKLGHSQDALHCRRGQL